MIDLSICDVEPTSKSMNVKFLESELNSTSAYVPAQLTKDKLLLYHIDSLT